MITNHSHRFYCRKLMGNEKLMDTAILYALLSRGSLFPFELETVVEIGMSSSNYHALKNFLFSPCPNFFQRCLF